VVRIETPDPPRDGWRGWMRAGLGDYHHSYAAGSFGIGNEAVGGWLRVIREKQDGFSEPDDLGDAVLASASGRQADLASTDVYGKLRYEPIDGLLLRTRLGWRLEDEEGLAQVANQLAIGSEEGEGTFDEERWLGGQDFVWEAGEATRLLGSVNWYQDGLESEVGRTFELDEQELSGRVALEHLLQTGPVSHNLTFGFDAFAPRLDLREDAPNFDVDVPIEIPEPERVDEDQRLGGVFAIAETELTSWLAFEGGLRIQFHGDYSPEPLPQVALLVTPWRPDEHRFLRLRASWGRGYRTPSLRDLYQPPVPQLGGVYFLAGNPDLSPEHVTSTRFGLEMVPIDRVALSLSVFHNDITDHIRSTLMGSVPIGSVVVPPPALTPELERLCELTGYTLPECNPEPTVVPINSPLFRKANLDSVVTQGIEGRVRVRPHRLAEFEVAYTYMDTDVVDSNLDIEALPNEPHHVVDVNGAFQIPRLGTVLVAQARWRGSALTETSGTGLASFTTFSESDPSLVIDLGVRQPLTRGFELFADVFNVTDERVVDSYVIRGTSFLVGITGRFD
jgi:outer membrane receptor protein involved in Fe transport